MLGVIAGLEAPPARGVRTSGHMCVSWYVIPAGVDLRANSLPVVDMHSVRGCVGYNILKWFWGFRVSRVLGFLGFRF